MRPEGVVLRRYRGRDEVLVRWEELFRQYLPAKRAGDVFATGAPSRWLSSPGDFVWAKLPGWICPHRVKVVRILAGCGEEIVRVKFRGRQDDFLLSWLRPCSNATGRVRPFDADRD